MNAQLQPTMGCNHTCKLCGKMEQGFWPDSLAKELFGQRLCFICNFWAQKCFIKNDPRTVRVDGEHYYIGADDEVPSYCRGYGGRRFKIRFRDGREVETSNLWCQGTIPPHFLDVLPDNAEFID